MLTRFGRRIEVGNPHGVDNSARNRDQLGTRLQDDPHAPPPKRRRSGSSAVRMRAPSAQKSQHRNACEPKGFKKLLFGAKSENDFKKTTTNTLERYLLDCNYTKQKK